MYNDLSAYTDNLTQISRSLYDAAISSDMTLKQAVSYLKENAHLRTLRESILKYASEPDSPAFRRKLTRGLQQIHPETAPDTVRRRVNDWMNTPERSIDKTAAIELCFVLDLSLDNANSFLAEVTEEGFHYRDPHELTYIFALSHGMDYAAAQAMQKRVGDLKFTDHTGEVAADSMTQTIRAEIAALDTEDELIDYIREAQPRLGHMHQTAYHLFSRMMDQLRRPKKETMTQMNWDKYDEKEMEERRLSVGDILQEYLHKKDVPTSKRNTALSPLHRAMLAQWPTEKELSQMKQRAIDVNRKVLLLLYLATEDFYAASEAEDFDALPPTDDDFFEDDFPEDDDADFRTALTLTNAMLSDCGLCQIDPRRPFDWMVLHCLCGEDLFMMDVQIQNFLRTLYGDTKKK